MHRLNADSSQLAVVVVAAEGKNFVMVGPPGTGKSQTIANMIVHNLGLGRTVLFVSEKAAALDVVYRRLRRCVAIAPTSSLRRGRSRGLVASDHARHLSSGTSWALSGIRKAGRGGTSQRSF